MRALAVGVTLVAFAAPALAAEPPIDTASSYALAWVRDEGAERCPAGRDFAEEVSRRLGRSPFDDRAERAIEIHVLRSAGAYTSHVYVRDRTGNVLGQRNLTSGEDCSVLFSATALAVALLIDPDATLHGDATASNAAAVFKGPAGAPPAAPQPAASAPSLPPPPPPPPPERSPTVVPPREERDEVASAALHSVLALGLAPGAEPGVELLVTARLSRRVSVDIGAAYATPGAATRAGTTFSVGVAAFNASAAFDLVSDGRLTAGAEAGAWLGALRTSLQSTTDPTVVPKDAGDFPFLAVGAGLGLRVHLSHALFVDARALALAPLLHRRLQIEHTRGSSDTVWSEPSVGGFGAAGLGVSFF